MSAAGEEKLRKAAVSFIETLRREAESSLANYSGLSDIVFDEAINHFKEGKDAIKEILDKIGKDEGYKDILHGIIDKVLFHIYFFFEVHPNIRRWDNCVAELRQLGNILICKMRNRQYIDIAEMLALRDLITESSKWTTRDIQPPSEQNNAPRTEQQNLPVQKSRFDESQCRAIKAVLSGDPLVLISGAAGTGKSTVIKAIEHELKKRGKNVILLAPTGMAAINIGGETIHSALKIPPVVNPVDEMREHHYLQNNQKLQDILQNVDTIIIDEISMVRADVMQTVCDILDIYGPEPDEDFGGVQLVLVGDLLQLPPVLTAGERKAFEDAGYSPERPYFFECLGIGTYGITSTPLTQNHRQQKIEDDISLLDCLYEMRTAVGERREGLEDCINSYCPEPDGTQLITLCATNDAANRINDKELFDLDGEPMLFKAEITDNRKHKDTKILSSFPSPKELWLKVGAKVMITKNIRNQQDRQELIPNGTMAKVAALQNDQIEITLLTVKPGLRLVLQKTTWESYSYTYNKKEQKLEKEVSISFTQYPLRPAWAITIHKSQGMTLENYAVDLTNASFAANLAYVALSRARRFEDIHLIKKLKASDLKFDPYMMLMNHIFETEKTVCPDDWKIRAMKFADTYKND